MWWSLLALLAPVGHDDLLVVHREPLVRVHGDTEEPRIGLKRCLYQNAWGALQVKMYQEAKVKTGNNSFQSKKQIYLNVCMVF